MVARFETESTNAIAVLQHEHTIAVETANNGTRSSRPEASFCNAEFTIERLSERHRTLLRQLDGTQNLDRLNRTAYCLLAASCCDRHFLAHAGKFEDRKSTRLNSSHSQISYAV